MHRVGPGSGTERAPQAVGDLDELLAGTGFEHPGRALDPSTAHLASPYSRRDYGRMADEVARLAPGPRLLDWGCGYGQLSYLLTVRGLEVASYDVGHALEDGGVPTTRGLRAVRGAYPSALPFRDRAFDAILACGVLEHVADDAASLRELRRVLAPGGRLLIYNLPQRWSYKEIVIDRLGLGYTHDRRYTQAGVTEVLARSGFRVERVRRGGFLPHLATGWPPVARRAYDRAAPLLWPLDRVLCQVPGLRAAAQSLEVVAVVAPERPRLTRTGRR